MPLFRAHPRDQRGEPLPAAGVQLDEVISDQTRARHRLSLRAARLAASLVPQNRALPQNPSPGRGDGGVGCRLTG